MSEIQILMEMGFPKERAEYALRITNNRGVEPAMEWLLAHSEEDLPEEDFANSGLEGGSPALRANLPESEGGTSEASRVSGSGAQGATLGGGSAGGVALGGATLGSATDERNASKGTGSTSYETTAKSLKCDVCNKILKDAADAEYHAAKTNHTNFSESSEEKPPLTEEEKKAQLAFIEEKLKQKRLEREQQERADALEREKNRIKSGKGMTEARRAMEEMEMKKIIEQRKREKAEEKAARERVKAQIEADKAARKAREEQQKGQTQAPAVTTSPATSSSNGEKAPPKVYTSTRIQIRLQDGGALQESFNVQEPLSAVRLFIQMKTNIEGPFKLMTSFPKKVFSDEDYFKPLSVLGLVPSAVIIMTK